jgi:hypothetical protein
VQKNKINYFLLLNKKDYKTNKIGYNSIEMRNYALLRNMKIKLIIKYISIHLFN